MLRQPELGRQIVEQRILHKLTQEELAFRCDVNVRTIQRLEAGEVNPRPTTLRLLTDVLEFEFNPTQIRTNKIWLVLLHFSNLLPIVIFPLLIWIYKRDEVPEMKRHGPDVINFQLTMCIYLFGLSALIILVIGVPLLILLGWYIGIITMINTIRVATDRDYRYPLTIHFIK